MRLQSLEKTSGMVHSAPGRHGVSVSFWHTEKNNITAAEAQVSYLDLKKNSTHTVATEYFK